MSDEQGLPKTLFTNHYSLITVVEMGARLSELFAQAPLYAILDTALRPDLPGMTILEAWLRAGIKVIQYRHKEPFQRAHFQQCCEMAARVRKAGGAFLVNDRADVAALCGAGGVHLGQDDLPVEQARLLLGEARIIGYSTHNREQALEAAGSSADYIAIGPVFPTSTKKDPDPVVGLEMVSAVVSEVRRLTAKPVVAIGGITMENAPAVLAAGAHAVAVASDLLSAADIEARAREFLAALRAT